MTLLSKFNHSRRISRIFDVSVAGLALIVTGPLVVLIATGIWIADRSSPIFESKRVGKGGSPFTMMKLRTMVPNAETMGGSSTSTIDPRLTNIGRLLRATKFDELLQLVNVLRGEMSLVGPRPNVLWAVATYSTEERLLLSVRPGITDISSIVFADEGEILAPFADPDLAYEQLIRPCKSRISLLYLGNASMSTDIRIIGLTLLNALSRRLALRRIARMVAALGASEELVRISSRKEALVPSPPPGFPNVITFVGQTPSGEQIEL